MTIDFGGHPDDDLTELEDGTVVNGSGERVDQGGAVEDPLLAGLRNGAWLHGQTFPELGWHVPGLIPEGASLFVGPPKVGKSWFLLGAGLAIASGGSALGKLAVKQRPVLYLALEDGDRRLQSRCRVLLEDGAQIPKAFEYLTRVQPGRVVATIRAWMARHPGAEPLVMLDTLGKVMPPSAPGESAYQRDYRIGSALKEAADDHPGSGVLINHHDRKAGSEDFVDAVSGTHGLAGAADTILVLCRARHETSGSLKVTGRDVEENEYAVELSNGGVWSLIGDDLQAAASTAENARVTAGLGDRSTEVITFVASRPQGVRRAEVSEALGIDPAQVGVYLARACDASPPRLARSGRGLYVPVTSVSSVTSAGATPSARNTRNGRIRGSEGLHVVGTCKRCARTDEPLVLGVCRVCAYPTEQNDEETP